MYLIKTKIIPYSGLLCKLVNVTNQKLEPTHICYALRGIAEVIEMLTKKEIQVSSSFYEYVTENSIYERFGEYPLDVARVNTWKIYSFDIQDKMKNIELYSDWLDSEIENVLRTGYTSRFGLVKLSAFCTPEIFEKVTKIMPLKDFIEKITFSCSNQVLAQSCGNILSKVCTVELKNCIKWIISCYLNENFEKIGKRRFLEVALPRILSDHKLAGNIILKKCEPFDKLELTLLAITVLRLKKIDFDCSIISINSLNELCRSNSIENRLYALSYIISCRKTSLPYTDVQLELIKTSLGMNLNLQKSLHRQNLTSIHVKIFQRLDASAAAGCKEEDVLNNYGDFISWLLNMIINNLIPGANMQRLVICLNLLSYLNKVTSPVLSELIRKILVKNGPLLHKSLIDCLFHSFTDVNISAFDNLIKLQNLTGENPAILSKSSEMDFISLLRKSTTITLVNGYTYQVKYRTMALIKDMNC